MSLVVFARESDESAVDMIMSPKDGCEHRDESAGPPGRICWLVGVEFVQETEDPTLG